MVTALLSKEVRALSRTSSRKGQGPLWKLARAGTQGPMMFPGPGFGSHICFFFVSLTYLSACSDFPCAFYSWVVYDNLPFH